jgi:glycosyltransferase involved in cell wall biosynthesis
MSSIPRIAINGRFLTQRSSGVQRFAAEVIKAIDRLVDADFAALKGRIEILAPRAARDFPLKNIPLRRVGHCTGYAWEQIEYPLHGIGQLLLNLCMLGPLAARHQIVVVHDATVQALPNNFSPRFRAAYKFLIPRLCRRSDLVVTVSEFSRREIGRWYGADVAAMPVCFEGGDHITAVPADASVIDRLNLKGRKFFLSVGVDSANKNIKAVVKAFQQAELDDAVLVLTGARDPKVFGHLNVAGGDGVRAVGFVSDPDLRALYEHALALVFPSYYEGFGLPPLEAMTCGCPVIISEQPALMEICGDAALTCQADDTPTIARHMRALAGDPALRERLAKAGRARAKRFTWESAACSLLDYCLALGQQKAA